MEVTGIFLALLNLLNLFVESKIMEGRTGLESDHVNNRTPLFKYLLRCVSIVLDLLVQTLFPVLASKVGRWTMKIILIWIWMIFQWMNSLR